jgi:hypothetical protein
VTIGTLVLLVFLGWVVWRRAERNQAAP